MPPKSPVVIANYQVPGYTVMTAGDTGPVLGFYREYLARPKAIPVVGCGLLIDSRERAP